MTDLTNTFDLPLETLVEELESEFELDLAVWDSKHQANKAMQPIYDRILKIAELQVLTAEALG